MTGPFPSPEVVKMPAHGVFPKLSGVLCQSPTGCRLRPGVWCRARSARAFRSGCQMFQPVCGKSVRPSSLRSHVCPATVSTRARPSRPRRRSLRGLREGPGRSSRSPHISACTMESAAGARLLTAQRLRSAAGSGRADAHGPPERDQPDPSPGSGLPSTRGGGAFPVRGTRACRWGSLCLTRRL